MCVHVCVCVCVCVGVRRASSAQGLRLSSRHSSRCENVLNPKKEHGMCPITPWNTSNLRRPIARARERVLFIGTQFSILYTFMHKVSSEK